MRKGINPQKNRIHELGPYFHQIIVPVYIPNQEGYFRDSFAMPNEPKIN